jgi:alpha-galactosidase
VTTRYRNGSTQPVTLEMLTSFSLGGLTPFAEDDAPGRLLVHRIRSSWASEGRLNSDPAERLQLEASFSRYSAACERFGQVGTMPVRQWFPSSRLPPSNAEFSIW